MNRSAPALRAPTRLCLLLLPLLLACYSGERRPLFGTDEPVPQPPPGSPPAPEHAQASPAELLAALRAESQEDRTRLAQELLRRGDLARPELEAALEEERLLLDLLEDLAAQLGAPQPRPASERSIEARWVRQKYRLALDRFLAGDMYGAIRLVESILVLEPDTILRPKLRRLRNRCRERLVRDSVLTADVVVEAPRPLLPADALRARIELSNLAAETITLRLDGRRTLGDLYLDYEELSPDGTRTRTRTQHAVTSDRDPLVIAPGHTATLTLKLPSAHRRLPAGLVGRYHLEGRLRAHTMLVGDAGYSMFIPLFSEDVVVVSPADAGLRDDPEAGFREAIVEASSGAHAARIEPARRAFVCAILMAQTDREGSIASLAAALRGASGPLSDALCAALARVTGEPLNFTREEWLFWWAGRSSRPQRTADPDPESGR